MQLFLKTVGATHRLVLPEDAPISAVKDAVEDITFIPSQLQSLLCGTSLLAAGTLADAGIEEADTLTLLMSINGGMRAKWRKKRMRRLRRKRRKMRQRAR